MKQNAVKIRRLPDLFSIFLQHFPVEDFLNSQSRDRPLIGVRSYKLTHFYIMESSRHLATFQVMNDPMTTAFALFLPDEILKYA